MIKLSDTEIDWRTYMQQVQCFLNGTFNYNDITGDTGPIVYPAGHLYIYSILYYVTNEGTDVRRAQYIFAVIYLVTLIAVFRIYWKSCMVCLYITLCFIALCLL